MPIVSLHDPAGITNELLGSLKPLVDDVQQGLHAYTRIKNLDHLLDANPGMLAHLGKSFDGSCQYRIPSSKSQSTSGGEYRDEAILAGADTFIPKEDLFKELIWTIRGLFPHRFKSANVVLSGAVEARNV